MQLYIIEGLDKTGKTTYTKNKFDDFSKIRLPGGFDYTNDMRKYFMSGNIPESEMIHILFGEHMAALQHLYLNLEKDYVLDRSFISYLVYQKELLMKYGFYDTYKKLLEEMFQKLTEKYDVKILYFSKRLIERKDDWLEYIDPDVLKSSFDEILEQDNLKNYVEYVEIVYKE